MQRDEHVYDPDALSGNPPAGGSAFAEALAAGPPEREFEQGLRPQSFDEFVGQSRVVDNLAVAIRAAKERGEPLDHVLFSGPPGLGKTSLARIVAHHLGGKLVATSGPALERPRDLVGILTQLERGDVLFIDEVHRVPAPVEEYLYTAMEDYSVDFTIDQGPHARVLPLAIAPFTLIGATTREALLTAPFRSRFGHLERLEPYPDTDLVRILARSARLLGWQLEPDAAALVAARSRGTPRVANRFLRRARDLAQVSRPASRKADDASGVIDAPLAADALARLGVDENGLEAMDRRILVHLARTPDQPVGLKTIAAAVGESEDTIEEVFEPHLLRMGLMLRTARGRMVTAEGVRAIGGPAAARRAAAGTGLFD